MGKRKLILIMSSVISITIIGGFVVSTISHANNNLKTGTASASTFFPITKENEGSDFTYIPPTLEASTNNNNETVKENEVPFVPETEIDLDVNSITVLVNKEFCLPKDYRPEDMIIPDVLFDLAYYDERKLMQREAADALELLFNEAKSEGFYLYGISAFRSYERQKSIFINNIVRRGKAHTLKYSAVPGTSEHQTGLAIDVSTKGLSYKLVASFATSPEGKWLAENAHRFGYIIRYPMGKEDITGYAYEPWHIRYVGEDLANYLYTNQLTLDEYYHYTPSEGFDFMQTYADLINYKPPVVTKAPEKEEDLEEELVEGDFEEDSEDSEDIEDPDLEDEASKDSEKDTSGKNSEDTVSKDKDQTDNSSKDQNQIDNSSKDQNQTGNSSKDQGQSGNGSQEQNGSDDNEAIDDGTTQSVVDEVDETKPDDNNPAVDNSTKPSDTTVNQPYNNDLYSIPENGIMNYYE